MDTHQYLPDSANDVVKQPPRLCQVYDAPAYDERPSYRVPEISEEKIQEIADDGGACDERPRYGVPEVGEEKVEDVVADNGEVRLEALKVRRRESKHEDETRLEDGGLDDLGALL